jgi:hypothetical protein
MEITVAQTPLRRAKNATTAGYFPWPQMNGTVSIRRHVPATADGCNRLEAILG